MATPAEGAQACVLRVARAEFLEELRQERTAFPWFEAEGRAGSQHDLVVGENLATILDHFVKQSRALPLPMALTIAMGISKRLSARSEPHLDLVPHHILLGYDGTIHLIDPAHSGPPQDLSRQTYRAPEHIEGQRLDGSTDVFGLGILLFEMTTGTRLFDPDAPDFEQRIMEARVPRPRDIVGDGYPIELQLVLRKLMRPSRAGRFATPRAAHDALRLVATTRADIGPGPLASWLASTLPARKAAWADLISERSQLEPVGPTETRPQAPPRAPTRPSSYLGSSQPTIQELQIDSPTVQAVRRQILADGETTVPPDSEQLALRAEVAKMKSRRTELVPIPGASAEITQPGAKYPNPRSPEETYEDLDVPTVNLQATRVARSKPQGLASSPPPTMVPELPTEISRRLGPIIPQSLGLEPQDSQAATSLDELVGPSDPLSAADLFDVQQDLISAPPALEAIAAQVPTLEWEPPAGDVELPPEPPLDFGLAVGVKAGSLADLVPDALLLPDADFEHLEAPPPTPSPRPAPELSEDLMLSAPEVTSVPQEASQLRYDESEPASNKTEEIGDTMQDEAIADLLDSEDLRQLQRAVQVEVPAPEAPPAQDDPHADITLQDDLPFPILKSAENSFEATQEPEALPDAHAVRGDRPKSESPAHAAKAAGRSPTAPNLGASAPPTYGEGSIATQVVRDRIVSSADPLQAASIAEPAPLNLSEAGSHSSTPDIAPSPRAGPIEEEESSGHLVIPISDADLKKSQNRRLWYWILPLAGVAVLLGVLLLVRMLTGPASEAPLSGRGLRPQAAPSEAPPTHDPADVPLVAPRPLKMPESEDDIPAPSELEDRQPSVPEPAEASGSVDPATETRSRPGRAGQAPRRRRAAPAPRSPAPELTQDPIQTWVLRVHALPEDSLIEVEGDRVTSASIVMLSGASPARVKITHPGYQTLTATVSPAPRVERHFILRKLR